MSIFKPISTKHLFTKKKIAAVSVINDLVSDSRVNRICKTLLECDYDVILIGRELANSPAIPVWPYKAVRMSMVFTSGPLFYLFFNLRLFIRLLFTKADLFYANDLDTLLPNYLVSKLKRKPLIYDSHELFCEVPELQQTPFKRRIWQRLEGYLVPKLRYAVTVNKSIANVFEKKYGTKFTIVRNIGEEEVGSVKKSREQLNIPENKKMLLLQGAGINVERGAEELVEAMKWIDNAVLYIIGGGDVWEKLEKIVIEMELSERVILIKRLPKVELMAYTANADLGLSIDKNTNLNYYYSLPNKLFDYINAGVPVLTSRLPELEAIITQYQIGELIDEVKPKEIADKVNQMLSSPKMAQYGINTQRARGELNWKAEQRNLKELVLKATYN